LNGVQVKANQTAFAWGRRCAHDWADVQTELAALKAARTPAQPVTWVQQSSLEGVIGLRVNLLTAYQDAAYAADYAARVSAVQAAESAVLAPGKTLALTRVVAEQLYRVMAIKDEYEVARLHRDPAFNARLKATFGDQFKREYHLAPPIIGKKDASGRPVKSQFGGWMMPVVGVLARLRFLRGTALDIFGLTEERKSERALRADYMALVARISKGLTPERHALAVELATVVANVKGFGHVKARNMAAARARWDSLLSQWTDA
jgi:indolepyruvate ferredoxin oxidoreductase